MQAIRVMAGVNLPPAALRYSNPLPNADVMTSADSPQKLVITETANERS